MRSYRAEEVSEAVYGQLMTAHDQLMIEMELSWMWQNMPSYRSVEQAPQIADNLLITS